MSDENSSPDAVFRDGTSQAARRPVALDPSYVSVDERSIQDFLAFSASYAKTLNYYGLENHPAGDWSGFLGLDPEDQNAIAEIAAFVEVPDKFAAAPAYDRYRRPHFALFLTFLKLLQQLQAQFNTFTRRHLEFYYRTVLQLAPKRSRPNQVHAVIELVDGQPYYLLPAGTLLAAGQDSGGADLFYATDGDILANQAKIASLKSAYTQTTVIGPADVRSNPELVLKDGSPFTSQKDWRFVAMMQMALGFQDPREPLPKFPLGDESDPSRKPLDSPLLTSLDGLLDFVQSNLFMSVSAFRSLMEVKRELDASLDPINGEWQKINAILQKAGQQKRQPPPWVLSITHADDFLTNLNNAVGDATTDGTITVSFDGLAGVNTIYDLDRQYRYYSLLPATDPPPAELKALEDFITGVFTGGKSKGLYLSLADFSSMMDAVDEMYEKWRRVSDILRTSGRKKEHANSGFTFTPTDLRKYDTDKFGTLLNNSLGPLILPTIPNQSLNTLDDLDKRIRQIEAFFWISAENFAFIRKINQQEAAATTLWQWKQVDAILTQARADKDLDSKKQELVDAYSHGGIEGMMRFALGDPKPNDSLPSGKPSFMSLVPSPEKDGPYITQEIFLDVTTVSFIQSTVIDQMANPSADYSDDWDRVYQIVGQAQRRKRGWTAPALEIEKWENLYVAEDATKVKVSLELEADQTTPRWRTFGDARSDATATPAKLGFAIASPLLALAEGTRTITVTLGFVKEGFDSTLLTSVLNETDSHGHPIIPFHFLLSTEKEIVEVLPFADAGSRPIRVIPNPDTSSVPGQPASYSYALQATLSLSVQDPPIAPLATGSTFPTPWPVLQILLKDIEDGEGIDQKLIKRYDVFRSLVLEKVHLQVKVDGLSGLFLQNEDGILDPKKPFEPFGAMPVVGSRFLFAHPEVCAKSLDTLGMDIDWMGVPDNFNNYYSGYGLTDYGQQKPPPSSYADNTVFTANLKLSDNHGIFEVTKNAPLFNSDSNNKTTGASQPQIITLIPSLSEIINTYSGYGPAIPLEQADEVVDWSRYWVLELNKPDFQHTAYPRYAAMAASLVDATNKPAPIVLNPPYTPKIKRLSLSYVSSVEISPPPANTPSVDQLYHITPFGCALLTKVAVDQDPNKSPAPCFFLPQYDQAGELYLGIADLAPPQSLSLLFQVAEGSADPDLPRESLSWDYLDRNTWNSLGTEGRLISDTTNGLLNSGIITFNLAAGQPGTLLTSDLYWIRASVARNCRSVGDLVDVRAQAVSATFLDRGNAPDHLDQPLPPVTIKDLAEPVPEVKAVHQPFTSFGGAPAEQDAQFYTRVSERLRHKNRALTCWDYERLILEAFPAIYKVKCLPVGSFEDPALADEIEIVVIPDIRGKLPFDPFEPKVAADMRLEIQQFLARHVPATASVAVRNPTYVYLKARFSVRLQDSGNPGYYLQRLNEDVQQYLSPWAYDQSAEIVLGGKICGNLIVNFVEERPYVDYLAGLQLFTSPDGRPPFTPVSLTESEPEITAGPDTILVSVRDHQIDLVTEERYVDEYFIGINFMEIELDFKVG